MISIIGYRIYDKKLRFRHNEHTYAALFKEPAKHKNSVSEPFVIENTGLDYLNLGYPVLGKVSGIRYNI